jgi:hypothetical protein
MPELVNSKIYRGGVTARSYSYETNRASYTVSIATNSIDFRFKLASKGGGTTEVLFQFSVSDLMPMLSQIASMFPENVDVLSECASIANKKNLQSLQEALKVQNSEYARAQDLKSKLEPVIEYVRDKYMEKDEDYDVELNVLNAIKSVHQSLETLSKKTNTSSKK